ncbi:MAG TPA: GNAT family N-acetyltransferase [Solirubrobacteraceae bacterium]|nr:GNAT family N-acetyltransferase [Solirubrobacteraceae bacterium]
MAGAGAGGRTGAGERRPAGSGAPAARGLEEAGIEVRWARAQKEVAGAFAVRERVFVDEQGVPAHEELDAHDEHARHAVALAYGSRVIGTLRLLVDGERAKVGRVAVDRAWRRRGVASRLLALALAGAREQGCTHVRLAAQVEASELYGKAGFAVASEVFEEAGIAHVWMELRLAGGAREP